MDCPPRVNISHYTHHNFRSGSAFRRVITSRLLSRGRTLTPSLSTRRLFQRTLSPGAECTCFNHLVRFAFGAHSWDFFFTRALQCAHQRKSFLSLPPLSNLGNRGGPWRFRALTGLDQFIKTIQRWIFLSPGVSPFNKSLTGLYSPGSLTLIKHGIRTRSSEGRSSFSSQRI